MTTHFVIQSLMMSAFTSDGKAWTANKTVDCMSPVVSKYLCNNLIVIKLLPKIIIKSYYVNCLLNYLITS